MKSIDDIIKERPYLDRVLKLYESFSGFSEIAEHLSGLDVENLNNYPRQYAEQVVSIIVTAFNLSQEMKDALVNVLSEPMVDLRKIPVEEVVLPIGDVSRKEMETVLFLYSRPFFMAERKRHNLDGLFWQEGKCPVCNATPSVSLIEKEQKRQFFCNYCGTTGPFSRLTCPGCGKDYSEGLEIVMFEGEEGMRADLCTECNLYWKSFLTDMLKDYSLELLDLISLPLDIVIQDRGYRRGSPNPIGMREMK